MARKKQIRLASAFCFLATFSSFPLTGQIPHAIKVVIPNYPAVGLASKLQGHIKFEIEISESGNVDSVKPIDSFTKVLAVIKPLTEALAKWRYEPKSIRKQIVTIELKILPREANILEETSEISAPSVISISRRAILLEPNHGY